MHPFKALNLIEDPLILYFMGEPCRIISSNFKYHVPCRVDRIKRSRCPPKRVSMMSWHDDFAKESVLVVDF